jgi:hypothetical protein
MSIFDPIEILASDLQRGDYLLGQRERGGHVSQGYTITNVQVDTGIVSARVFIGNSSMDHEYSSGELVTVIRA